MMSTFYTPGTITTGSTTSSCVVWNFFLVTGTPSVVWSKPRTVADVARKNNNCINVTLFICIDIMWISAGSAAKRLFQEISLDICEDSNSFPKHFRLKLIILFIPIIDAVHATNKNSRIAWAIYLILGNFPSRVCIIGPLSFITDNR